uniref:Uncharacterized protein n=1 Tax=Candidatus Methanophagaceae archaeon ANME-1 ERB6 TaxID=2759912 RepID=A0A7G9YX21_9EURY|nr:hypothetical protein BJKGENCM_00045 [Methanosarcinales archaeon ANME-1 ERB6]
MKEKEILKFEGTGNLQYWHCTELQLPPIHTIVPIMNALHNLYEPAPSDYIEDLLGEEKEIIVTMWVGKETNETGIADAVAVEDYRPNLLVLRIKAEDKEKIVETIKYKIEKQV